MAIQDAYKIFSYKARIALTQDGNKVREIIID